MSRETDDRGEILSFKRSLENEDGARIRLIEHEPLPMSSAEIRAMLPKAGGAELLDDGVYSLIIKNRWYAAGIKAAVAIGEDADHEILARFTGNPDSVVTANNGEALAKLIKFVAVTSSQIGSRSMRLAETEEDFRTKQESAAEQIREFAESDEINVDIEAGW